jgi:hypothetical protein
VSRFCIIAGILLIVLGSVAWTGTDKTFFNEPVAAAEPDGSVKKASITAMIPAFVGFPLLILGTLGLQPAWRKHAMHLAAVVALLGALAGLGRGLMKISDALSAATYDEARPVIFSLLMGLICLAVLLAAIGSFRAARRARAVDAH